MLRQRKSVQGGVKDSQKMESSFFDALYVMPPLTNGGHYSFARVVFPMLKMGHFRESVKKTTFRFTSKSILCFFFPPIRDIFAV